MPLNTWEPTASSVKDAVTSGKMNRRDFIQLCLATGLSVSGASTLYSSIARANPKRGGTFRMGIGDGSNNDSLDPATWSSTFAWLFGPAFFGACLTEIDEKNAVKPNLAESIEADQSSKRWVFKLRKGLEFHNGKTVNAEDVVATYNYHRGEQSKSGVKALVEQISEIKADGPETVIFALKNGSADFPYITADYHLPIYPANSTGGIDWQNAVSVGPYILESFEPGVFATGKRNPNYHKTGMPYFDKVELRVIIDAAARTNALLAGDLEYANRCDLKTISFLKNNTNLEIDNIAGFSHWIGLMNTTMAPFNDPNVRLALKWAMDREEIVEKILFGYGTPGNDNPIGPSIRFASNPSPVHKHDPEKARFYLNKAGLDTLTVDLSASDAAFAGALDAAMLMSANAAKAGIKINVVREASDGYWQNVWMKKPFCLSYWGGRPTVDWMFTTAYAADAPWNDTFWKHPKFNELLLTARSEQDDNKRAAMYGEMQQILHDDGGALVLAFNNYVSAHSKAVAHGPLNSNADSDGCMLLERWWFA